MGKYIYESKYLMHHGIKGQKWGVENGPAYPLNPQRDYSKAELKELKNIPKVYNRHKKRSMVDANIAVGNKIVNISRAIRNDPELLKIKSKKDDHRIKILDDEDDLNDGKIKKYTERKNFVKDAAKTAIAYDVYNDGLKALNDKEEILSSISSMIEDESPGYVRASKMIDKGMNVKNWVATDLKIQQQYTNRLVDVIDDYLGDYGNVPIDTYMSGKTKTIKDTVNNIINHAGSNISLALNAYPYTPSNLNEKKFKECLDQAEKYMNDNDDIIQFLKDNYPFAKMD